MSKTDKSTEFINLVQEMSQTPFFHETNDVLDPSSGTGIIVHGHAPHRRGRIAVAANVAPPLQGKLGFKANNSCKPS